MDRPSPRDLPLDSDARFRAIFDHSNDAIFLLDPASDEILDVNSRACRMLGYTKQELLALPMSKVHPHEIRRLTLFSESVLKGGDGWTDELSCRTKGGRIVASEISASVVKLGDRTCMIALVRDISARVRLAGENESLHHDIRTELRLASMIGESPALAKVLRQIEVVAPTDAAVLITGESGTGKELVARAIHDASPRRQRNLVRVNCASIPAELFESEFFGHVKGAFTGALKDRTGRFELADEGTLLLDEVGDIPLSLQGKLLRVLQEGEFERVGESHTRKVDVRVLAATNRDLMRAFREGRFREDLYYRLSVFPIEVPPLRERREDIAALAVHCIAQSCSRHGFPRLPLTRRDRRILEAYYWPGNVRELQNIIDRAVIVGGGRWLDLGQLPSRADKSGARDLAASQLTLADVEDLERDVIRRALREADGKIYGKNGAAAKLALRPTTLSSRIDRMKLRELVDELKAG